MTGLSIRLRERPGKRKRQKNDFTAHLDRKDADECMNGEKCVHLGIKIGEFLKNFE